MLASYTDGVGGYIAYSSVLSDRDIIVIWFAGLAIKDDVFENGAEADGTVDLWLLLGGEVDGLGVASTFNVESVVGRSAPPIIPATR